MSVFTNIQRELSLLNQRSARPKAEFVVICGRCRIGISELIDQFINNRSFKALHVEKASLSPAERFTHSGILYTASDPGPCAGGYQGYGADFCFI
ncbi:MAG: hypothetical protein HF976_04380 [ANME-2 cluster archaeon]|nr:hypothetical protein [ANME-2 cluster archaeon]MBC2706203.1 hypothetical protein [ANME-2 cluster archaeon]MBC2746740.1 hypothetical protein [ANME-2 cluster archaeon]